MTSRSCRTCDYWSAIHNGGECRKNPPKPALIPGPQGPVAVGMHPPTPAEHWCGEYKPDPIQVAAQEKRGVRAANGSLAVAQ
jgi:hypothetical protein